MSMYTVNMYMNEDFEGGSTRFYDDDVSGGVSFAVCTPAHASDSRSVCKSRRVHVVAGTTNIGSLRCISPATQCRAAA
jgi:hypothetical protein